MRDDRDGGEDSRHAGRGARKRDIAHLLLGRSAFLAVANLAIGFLAYMGAWVVRMSIELPYTQALLPQERWDVVAHPWWAMGISQLFLLYIFGLFDDLRATRYREIVTFAFAACVLQMLTVTSIFFLRNQIFPRTVILVFDTLNFGLLCVWHFIVKRLLSRRIVRVLVVSEGSDSARDIIQDIRKSPWMGMHVVGLALRDHPGDVSLGYPVLGNLDDIEEVIVSNRIEQVIFASEGSWKDRVLNSLSRLQESTPVQVAIVPSPFEIVIGRLRHITIHDTPLIEVRRNPNEPFERLLKRSFDVAFAAVCLALFLVFGLVLAVLVKVLSPGPVFYLQERVGYGGRIFRLIKFRTMIPNAEENSGEIYATVNDPRVTPIGRVLRRFRIDEIPQLLNVFKGDMSFVGPRPERPGFVRTFEKQVFGYHERHKVKPGITGLAQVRSYYETTAETKLKYDLAYIYNYSFLLDMLILLETVKVILIRRGS